jgi:hypothetical protein
MTNGTRGISLICVHLQTAAQSQAEWELCWGDDSVENFDT